MFQASSAPDWSHPCRNTVQNFDSSFYGFSRFHYQKDVPKSIYLVIWEWPSRRPSYWGRGADHRTTQVLAVTRPDNHLCHIPCVFQSWRRMLILILALKKKMEISSHFQIPGCLTVYMALKTCGQFQLHFLPQDILLLLWMKLSWSRKSLQELSRSQNVF